jgi:hypothetical protein
MEPTQTKEGIGAIGYTKPFGLSKKQDRKKHVEG